MLISFCRYFFSYLFHAKTRQKLLFLAIFGLFLSSFALLVLQSTMGGLQRNLITRSKSVDGAALIHLKKSERTSFESLEVFLEDKGINYVMEYELELLLRHKNYLSPVIVHGLDKKNMPSFLDNKEFEDALIGMDLAMKIGASYGSKVQLISPAHVDSFFGDIPRSAVLYLDELVRTDVPEVDLFHLWMRLPLLQNLTRERVVNRVRIYTNYEKDINLVREFVKDKDYVSQFLTWEERNQTLVWALNLESLVMVFLFITMTLLVSLCITSGLLIFFDKIKLDLASFWILGSSKKNLEFASSIFLFFMCLSSIALGIGAGLLFLHYFDVYGVEILPDVFVDRKIPIYITSKGLIISFAVPAFISIIFTLFSLREFKRDQSYLHHIRSIG